MLVKKVKLPIQEQNKITNLERHNPFKFKQIASGRTTKVIIEKNEKAKKFIDKNIVWGLYNQKEFYRISRKSN